VKLSLLRLRRAPGLDKGLGELRFEAGLNVVFGPNESGKSTLARAIQSTLWPVGRKPGSVIDVESEWSEGDRSWSARYDGDTTWSRDGEVVTQPELPGPENSTAYRLHLRDLIADVGEGHEDFAKRVREALDGGYDLMRRVTEERSRRHGLNEKRALGNAERELREIETKRAALGRKFDDLGRLEAEKQAADDARREAELLQRVRSLLTARERLESARVALAADTTPDLLGHEQDELAGLDHALAQCEAERAALETDLREARDTLVGLALPEALPETALLEAWLEALRTLAEQERKLADARAAESVAAGGEARAREALLATESDRPEDDALRFPPSLEQIEELAGWLDRRSRLADARHALEARRARLGEAAASTRGTAAPELPDLEGIGEEALVRARGLVASYLRSGPGAAWPIVVAGLAGAALAALSWRALLPLERLPVQGPESGLVAALAVAATMLGGGLGALLGHGLARRRLSKGLREAGLVAAASKTKPALLFDALDDRVRAQRSEAERTQERERLDLELRELDARAPALEELRRRLVEQLGIDPGLDDLTVVEWARRLQAHRTAAEALGDARSATAHLEREVEAERGRLFSALAAFVEDGPETVAEAIRALEGLRQRIDSAEHAGGAILRTQRAQGQVDAREREHAASRSALLERLGLHTLDAASASEQLRRWTEALPERHAKQAAVESAAAVVAEFEGELADHDDLRTLDAFEAERRLEAALARAEKATELSQEIGAIRREVELAQREDGAEVALARVNQARDALERRRMEVFEGVAARLLLEDVSEQIGTRQRPEVLSRATELFGLFTRHRYELEVAHDGDSAHFLARATESNQRKRLEQLSDGTRMQLLLAARLAFVHDGEHELHPPLVLDEALSSSDTTRMDAMTDALVAEARTDRQVFYMTNDWGDVDRWKAACDRAGAPPPHVVHLGEAGREAHAAAWEDFEPPALVAPVPSPKGLTAAEYAALLGVPLPDPWDSLGRLHLFHLLADDLELVRDVLENGHVERFGQFESRRRNGVAAELLGSEIVDRIVFRGRVAERFFAAWRRGRGKRLRPGDLDACDSVSDAYRDRLSQVMEEVGGDARALMERIAAKQDERVKGFREKSRVGLEEYLLEHGFLSSEAPLADDELASEVSTGLGEFVFEAGREEGRARLREAEMLVRLWVGLLRHGDDAA
jgi:ABC-type molybdenum transport system ATPase subunit/photorepair protein PhrA